MRRCLVLFVFVLAVSMVQASGSAESAAATSGRGEYLAGQGIIIPPNEVHVDSYIAAMDYLYPDPESDFGVAMYSGHRQISVQGQRELILGDRLTGKTVVAVW